MECENEDENCMDTSDLFFTIGQSESFTIGESDFITDSSLRGDRPCYSCLIVFFGKLKSFVTIDWGSGLI